MNIFLKKCNMKLLFLAILIGCNINIFAQKIEYLLSTAGGISKGDKINIEFAIGETLINNYKNNFYISEGIIQPTVFLSNNSDKNEDIFYIYPNPASSLLMVGFEKMEGYKVCLFDFKNNIFEFDLKDISIDISSLPSGIYIIIVYDRNLEKKFVGKLIKI